MKTSEKLYLDIVNTCLNESEEIALNTIVTFLTNLRGEDMKIDWIIESLELIKKGSK